MKDVKNLLRNARDNYKASLLLLREGYPNIAVSRAYYSMFYAAEALLLSRGFVFSSHSAVISAFGKEFSKTGEIDPKFHRYLIDAQDARNLGDYGAGIRISEDRAKEVIEWAKEFLKVIDQQLGDPYNPL